MYYRQHNLIQKKEEKGGSGPYVSHFRPITVERQEEGKLYQDKKKEKKRKKLGIIKSKIK